MCYGDAIINFILSFLRAVHFHFPHALTVETHKRLMVRAMLSGRALVNAKTFVQLDDKFSPRGEFALILIVVENNSSSSLHCA